jgi:tricarballylate dehydrogenase
MNHYYRTLAASGVPVLYETCVEEMHLVGNRCAALTVNTPEGRRTVKATSFVAAAGGFEANLEWLARYWGEGTRNYHIRGPHFNDGIVLAELLRGGASSAGEERGFHSVAVDARSPKFDGGIATRIDSIPFGVVLNRDAQRFYDEGEDIWPKRYAIWGSLVAEQPGQIAFSIVDAKAMGTFMPSVFPPVVASSIRELAAALGLSPERLEHTVSTFNQTVRPGTFNHAALDDCHTEGLTPAKSHWAQRLDTPPFWGYPLRPGITFTYLGVKVDERARVLWANGEPARNIYAAGEIMAGNILRRGYIAGIGMTIGTVFGRIAGEQAGATCRT